MTERPVIAPGARAPSIAAVRAATARLLKHLNANRAYYRLAIDLQRDSVSRFMDLSQRCPREKVPTDMNPVGVAGRHIAFICDRDQADVKGERGNLDASGKEKVVHGNNAPVHRLVAMATSAVFLEAIRGAHELDATPGETVPSISDFEGKLTWPAPVSALGFPTRGAAPTTEAAAPEPGEDPVSSGAISMADLKELLSNQTAELSKRIDEIGNALPGTGDASGASAASGASDGAADDQGATETGDADAGEGKGPPSPD